jgi:hypothetical protein
VTEIIQKNNILIDKVPHKFKDIPNNRYRQNLSRCISEDIDSVVVEEANKK